MSKSKKSLLSSTAAIQDWKGTVELQQDELGRGFINIPVPPGYKAVTKDGMPIDGWPCKELKWNEDGDGFFLELPEEITLVKVEH